MESEWRYNVALLGQSGTTWELAARLVTIPGLFLYVVKQNDGFWSVWRFSPSIFAIPTLAAGPFPIGSGDRFPYGQAVNPD